MRRATPDKVTRDTADWLLDQAGLKGQKGDRRLVWRCGVPGHEHATPEEAGACAIHHADAGRGTRRGDGGQARRQDDV